MSETLQLGKIRVTAEGCASDLFRKLRTRYRRAAERQEPLNGILEALRIEILAAGSRATLAVSGKPWPEADATTPRFSRIMPRRKSPHRFAPIPPLVRCKHGRYPSPRRPCGKCTLEWVHREERRADAKMPAFAGRSHAKHSQASFDWKPYGHQAAL